MHVPGLVVLAPSNPYDAKGLMLAALRDDNPVVFLEHKLAYLGPAQPVPEGDYLSVSLGKPGAVDSPEVRSAVEHIVAAAIDARVLPWIPVFATDRERLQDQLADWSARRLASTAAAPTRVEALAPNSAMFIRSVSDSDRPLGRRRDVLRSLRRAGHLVSAAMLAFVESLVGTGDESSRIVTLSHGGNPTRNGHGEENVLAGPSPNLHRPGAQPDFLG